MTNKPKVGYDAAYPENPDRNSVLVDNHEIRVTIFLKETERLDNGSLFFHSYVAAGHEILGDQRVSSHEAFDAGGPLS